MHSFNKKKKIYILCAIKKKWVPFSMRFWEVVHTNGDLSLPLPISYSLGRSSFTVIQSYLSC